MNNLTDREKAVMEMLADGLTQKEMSQKAFMSEETVYTILRILRARYGCFNRPHLVAKWKDYCHQQKIKEMCF